MRQHLQLRLYSKRGRYEKISIFLICSLLMIFGLSFSACADTTGGVTATAVAPRAVDSFGNIIDTSENVNHVEYASSTKVTTTETTTTKPAYNQEEMKKTLKISVRKIWLLRQ